MFSSSEKRLVPMLLLLPTWQDALSADYRLFFSVKITFQLSL